MMDELFFSVFNNKVLSRLIFSKVKHIHRDILLFTERELFSWCQLIDNIELLTYYSYLKEIKQYHKIVYMGYTLAENIMKGNLLDVLQHFINKQPEILNFKGQKDLLYYSVKYNRFEIFKYLESFIYNNNNNDSNKKLKTSISSSPSSSLRTTTKVEWNYYDAISIVPKSGNMEMFLYLLDKIDIRSTLLKKSKKMRYEDEIKIESIIEAIGISGEYGRSKMLEHIFRLFKSDRHLLDDILLDSIPVIIKRIIKNGHIHIIQQYYNNNKIHSKLSDSMLLFNCAEHNQFEMMKYIYDNKLGSNSFSNKTIDFAGFHGNLEMIKWLHYNLPKGFTPSSMECAAMNGHLEVVEWLHHNRTEGCTTDAMDCTAESGHLEMIKWLQFNRSEGCTTDAMDMAAENGHLEVVKWLQFNRTEGCTTKAMDEAAANGHLEVVKWLHENRTEGCTTNAMDKGAANGHLEVVKWLLHNRTEGCTANAKDMAKWLHYNRTKGSR